MNDLVGPNQLVLTLLIFSIYPKITKLDTSPLSITQRIMAIKKFIKEV